MSGKVSIKDLVSLDYVIVQPSESIVDIKRKLAAGRKYVVLQDGSKIRVQTRDFVIKAIENNPGMSLVTLGKILIPAAIIKAHQQFLLRPRKAFAVMSGNNLVGVFLQDEQGKPNFTGKPLSKTISFGDVGSTTIKNDGIEFPNFGRETTGGNPGRDISRGYSVTRGGGNAGSIRNSPVGEDNDGRNVSNTKRTAKKGDGVNGRKQAVGKKPSAPKPTSRGASRVKGPGKNEGHEKPQLSSKNDFESSKTDKEPYYLNVKYKEKAVIKHSVRIEVNVSKKQEEAKTSLIAMVTKSDPITVILTLRSGFELQSPQVCTVIPDEIEGQTKCTFDIIPMKAGIGNASVLAFQNGQQLGSIEFSIQIFKTERESKSSFATAKLNPRRSTSPDLTLLISEQKTTNDETNIHFTINASDSNLKIFYKSYGPVPIKKDPANYFNSLFADFDGFNNGIFKKGRVTIDQMERLGTMLYGSLIPAELKSLLWEIKDKIKTIMITSSEPFIPWEICRMFGTENESTVEYGFLAEKFEVTRWIPGYGFPEPKLGLFKWAVVVPKNSGLSSAKEELKFLKKLAGSKYEMSEIDANYLDIKNNLQSGAYNLWHFSGHGSAQDIGDPNKAMMYLENDETFIPDYLSGTVANLGKGKPMVFLNACQIGRGGIGLTGIGGWAAKFLQSGASIFIGAYWSILDDSALQFAKELYNSLIKDKLTIGEAAFKARNKIRPNGDPAWLAYVVYADPYAKIA